MSIRSDQRTALINILNTIVYNANPIAVLNSYVNNANSYPYFYVLSGGIRTEFMSNRVYKQYREYYINLVFSVNQALDSSIIDTVEELFVAKLLNSNTRDEQFPIWQDLIIKEVSSPYQDEISFKDNMVIKTISIECETEPTYN